MDKITTHNNVYSAYPSGYAPYTKRCLQAGFVYSVGVIFWSTSRGLFCFMSMVCLPYIFTKSKEILGVKAEKPRFFLGKGRQRYKTVA